MINAMLHARSWQRWSVAGAAMIAISLSARAQAGEMPPCLNPITVDGEAELTGFASTAIETVRDFDDDGVRDLVVGADLYPTQGVNIGRAYFFSGATGRLVRTIDGEELGALFGSHIVAAGDLNGDGFDEVLIAAVFYRGAAGRVYIYSTRDGSLIRFLDPIPSQPTHQSFGKAMVNLGDVNGDGITDQAIGAPEWGPPSPGIAWGRMYVFSGADGAMLYHVEGEQPDNWFGSVMTGLEDHDGDAVRDILVTAHRWTTGGPRGMIGRVYVLSGVDGKVIHTFEGDYPDSGFGGALASFGDLNGDGYEEIGIADLDKVRIYSTADYSVMYTFQLTYQGFGARLERVGDVNGDFVNDILLSQHQDFTYGTFAGKVFVRSGVDGTTLSSCAGQAPGDHFGIALAGAGDMNDDGLADFWVGAPEFPGDVGYAKLFLGSLSSDIDGDGDVDGIDLALLLGRWGPCEGCPEDIVLDGEVNSCDLDTLLANWTARR